MHSCYNIIWMILLFIKLTSVYGSNINGPEIVKKIFEFYENENSVGIPGVDLEDPMILPPEASQLIELKRGWVKGHSKIDIKLFDFDFNTLSGWLDAVIPRVDIFGNYSWPGFFYSSKGFMNITLMDLKIDANYTMHINEIDQLRLSDFQITINKEKLLYKFTGLIWEHETFLSSGAFDFLFDEMLQMNIDWYRPIIIREVNKKLRDLFLNLASSKLRVYGGVRRPVTSPSSLLFLSQVVKHLGFDPFKLPDRAVNLMGWEAAIRDITLHGLSRVNIIKSLRIIYRHRKLYIESWMHYPKLDIYYAWGISAGIFRDIMFYEENRLRAVDMKINVVIDLSLKKSPRISHFHLKPESYDQARGRSRNLWRRIQYFFTNLGSSIRKNIVNTLAQVLKLIMQDHLNRTDVKEMVSSLV